MDLFREKHSADRVGPSQRASAALEAHSTEKSVGHYREQMRPQQVVWLVFNGPGNFIG